MYICIYVIICIYPLNIYGVAFLLFLFHRILAASVLNLRVSLQARQWQPDECQCREPRHTANEPSYGSHGSNG